MSAFSGLLTDEGVGQKGPLPKIFHTYSTLKKYGTVIPYLKGDQKRNKSRDPLLEFFLPEISNFCYIKKH